MCWHMTGSALVSITGNLINVTERKEAEQELLRLRRSVENSFTSIVITDPEGLIFRFLFIRWSYSEKNCMLHYFRSSAAGTARVSRPCEAAAWAGTIRFHPAIEADLGRSKPILHNYVGV